MTSHSHVTARIRILETTDLHMQLLAYDYFTDKPTPGVGLVPLAGLIETHRRDPQVTTFLFDNGDFLQGNPLADFLAQDPQSEKPHPMITAMNLLQYDAVCLGNHEFNYGLPFLANCLGSAAFPAVCANATLSTGAPFVPPFTIVEKDVTCSDGTQRSVRIGVLGLVTPQIVKWDRTVLNGSLQTADIVATAKHFAPIMRAQGADVIVALCHSGMRETDWHHGMENAAIPLAQIEDIDVLLMGHTHETFPAVNPDKSDCADHSKGQINGKPAVMAGFYGSHLGVVTLSLAWGARGWSIAASEAQLDTPHTETQSPLQQSLGDLVAQDHASTLAHIRQPIARTALPITSHFANTAPDLSLELLADAQTGALQQAALGTEWENLPIISAVAPFRAGGLGGPAHYIDIAAGDLTLRDASAICPFSNQLYGVARSGRQIKAWLEKSALCFHTVQQGVTRQPLHNLDVPPYNFDTLYGLSYRFDLSRTDRRLTDLCYNGQAVNDADRFVVATNSYRANGGGDFFTADAADVLFRSTRSVRDILIDALRKRQQISEQPRRVWQFASLGDTTARFLSAPTAIAPSGSAILATGETERGFGVFEIAI